MGGIAAVCIQSSTGQARTLAEQMAGLSAFRGAAQVHLLGNTALLAQTSQEEGHLLSGQQSATAFNGYIRTPGGGATRAAGARLHEQSWWTGGAASPLEQLDGEYSIVTHPPGGHHLHVACSLFGTRPLYYRQAKGLLLIGTDIRQLFPPLLGHGPEPAEDLLTEYLQFFRVESQTDATYYQDVKRITPGYIYTFDTARPERPPQRDAFWQPPPPRQDGAWGTDIPRQSARLLELIRESLLGSLSASKTTVALSGGLDSSTLWSLLRSEPDRRCQQVEAASKVFPGQKCDESAFIDALERKYPAPIARIDHSDMRSGDSISGMTRALDYLVWPNAYYLERFLPELGARDNRILILGFGSDELLSPGIAYLADDVEHGHWLSSMQRMLRHRPAGSEFDLVMAVRKWLGAVVRPSHTLPGALMRRFRPLTAPDWVHPRRREALRLMIGRHEARRRAQGHARTRILDQLAWHGNIGIAPYEQRAAMQGQSIRNPFLSRKLLDFALDTPPHTLLPHGRQEKELLRIAVGGLVPKTITQRQVRTEFGTIQTLDPQLLANLEAPAGWELCRREIADPAALQAGCTKVDRDKPLPHWLAFLACTEHFLRKFTGD